VLIPCSAILFTAFTVSQLETLVGSVDEAEATNHSLLAMIRKHGLETEWIQQTTGNEQISHGTISSGDSGAGPAHPAVSADTAASAQAASQAPHASGTSGGNSTGADNSGHGFDFARSRGKSVQAVPVMPLEMPNIRSSSTVSGSCVSQNPQSAASSTHSSFSQQSPAHKPAAAPSAMAQHLVDLSGDDAHLLSSVSAAQTHFIITDPTLPDNPIVFASAGFYHLTGYGPSDILGHNCRFLQGRDTDSRTIARLSQAVQSGVDCRAVVLNYTKTGVPFWNDLFVAPLKDRHGHVVHFVGVQSNISPLRAKALLELMGPYGGVVTSEPIQGDGKFASAQSKTTVSTTLAHGMSDAQLKAAVQAGVASSVLS